MIILNMAGGLGNQMFFYALYAKLEEQGREIAVDDESEYAVSAAAGMPRKPVLEETFGITYRRASAQELRELTGAGAGRIARAYRKRIAKKPYLPLVHDVPLTFDAKILALEDARLQGYFQSPKYFEGMEEKLFKAFSFREDTLLKARGWKSCAAMIGRAEEPVSVHLRFGDYETLQDTYGGICTDAYYDRAIREIRNALESPRFFIFSNDAEKAEQWLAKRREAGVFPPGGAVLIEGSDEEAGGRDMELMSRCRHHIIANSSFSWWGAYLSRLRAEYGEDGGKESRAGKGLVFAPSFWIRRPDGSGIACRDIYTDGMSLISPAGSLVRVPEGETRIHRDLPKISVIVAAYNIEKYLDRAMQSLTAQTYPNLEIILVDDGSTDNTRAICNTWGRRHPNVRVIHKENGGLSDARNAGLAEATGEYIGYLDGDDYVEPAMFETLLCGMLSADAQLAVTRYREVSDEAARSGAGAAAAGEDAWTNLKRSRCYTRQEALEIYLSGDRSRATIYNSVWSKLFRREIVDDLRFPVGRNSEDILYTTRALCRIQRCVYVDVPLYDYVVDRSGSIMNEKKGARRLEDEIPFWREQIAYLRQQGEEELADRAAYAFWRRMLYYDRDFRAEEGMFSFARKLEEDLAAEKDEIRRVYAKPFVQTGDRARMKLFLFSPEKYDRWAGWYEKKIIPLRLRLRDAAGRKAPKGQTPEGQIPDEQIPEGQTPEGRA